MALTAPSTTSAPARAPQATAGCSRGEDPARLDIEQEVLGTPDTGEHLTGMRRLVGAMVAAVVGTWWLGV
jgi:hypothetical protein